MMYFNKTLLLLMIPLALILTGCDEKIHTNNQQVISGDSAVFPIDVESKYFRPLVVDYMDTSSGYETLKDTYIKKLYDDHNNSKTNSKKFVRIEEFISYKNRLTAEPQDKVSVSDEFIRAYFEYNEAIRPYVADLQKRPYIPNFETKVSFSRSKHCYSVYVEVPENDYEKTTFIAFEQIELDSYLLTESSKECFEKGEEDYLTIQFGKNINSELFYFHRNEDYQSYTTFADWARSLSRLKKLWYGIRIDESKLNGTVEYGPEVDGYSPSHTVLSEADQEHDLTVMVQKPAAYKAYFQKNKLSLKLYPIPEFLKESYDYEKLVYQAHVKLENTKARLIQDERVRIEEQIRLENERIQKEKQAAEERERLKQAAVIAEAKRKKQAEMREAKNREDIFYFAKLDNADVYHVRKAQVSQLSGVGKVTSGFLGMNTHSTLNFNYTPMARDQNPLDAKPGETHRYFKHIGGNRYEVLFKITNNAISRSCHNKWVENGNTVQIDFMHKHDFSIDTPYIWKVSTVGRNCKYGGIDLRPNFLPFSGRVI